MRRRAGQTQDELGERRTSRINMQGALGITAARAQAQKPIMRILDLMMMPMTMTLPLHLPLCSVFLLSLSLCAPLSVVYPPQVPLIVTISPRADTQRSKNSCYPGHCFFRIDRTAIAAHPFAIHTHTQRHTHTIRRSCSYC